MSTTSMKMESTIVNIPVISQNNEQQFRSIAVRCLVWKLDRRLIPFLVLLEIGSYINRLSIGHAKLMSIKIELPMSSSSFNWAISLFYLSYLIFEIPSTILLRCFGPTRYLSLSLILWGVITVGMAFVTNAQQLLIARFLLGMVQSGFFTGTIIYFSLWYCKREQIMRFSILFGAVFAAGVLDGILAYGIRHMEGICNLQDWQWLFLLEGLPIIPLGIITYVFLGSIPDTVQWLNNAEKQLLTNLLRDDAGLANCEPTSSTRLSWRQVRYVFIDWRIYLYVIIGIGDLAVFKCLTMYLPELIQYMRGIEEKEVHLITIPLYFIACICCLLAGYSSSRHNEHGFHIAFCLSVALLGFILMITLFDKDNIAIYISTCIACCGTFSAFPLLLSWLTNNVGGHTKRAMAVGFLIGIGQIGGVLAPQVYPDDDHLAYRRGHFICIGLIIVSLISTFILRICLKIENHRRTHLSVDNYNRESSIPEPCDWHPNIRYVL